MKTIHVKLNLPKIYGFIFIVFVSQSMDKEKWEMKIDSGLYALEDSDCEKSQVKMALWKGEIEKSSSTGSDVT